jgi:Stress responsive A/B Barrel Domain
MILHLAFFSWNEDVTAEEVAELTSALRDMAAALPMLRSYECGENLRVRPSDVDYAVAAVVDDEEALRAYLDSEGHKVVYDRLLGRMIATRAAAQLRVERAL